MRPEFFEQLYQQMLTNPDIYALTGDLGYGGFDKIKSMFPDRFINCGASEQAMVGIAVGLALKGKIPFVYTISSFFLRAAETISLYLSHEQVAVHLIGSGRDQDYAHDGYSHDATQVQKYLKDLDIINNYPETKEEIPELVDLLVKTKGPTFTSLRR